MGIRNRLLILLLTVALIPLLAVTALHQVSIRLARQRLGSRTREALDSSARRALEQLLYSHAEIFARERQLVDSLIHRQAREVEIRLAQEALEPSTDGGAGFGFSPDLAPLGDAGQANVQISFGTDESPPETDYRRQQLFLAQDADPLVVADDICRLHTMTTAYHEIYRLAPHGTLWLYTSLENGLHTAYPGGSSELDRQGYDPRQRPWYQKAKTAGEIVRDGPGVDAATAQTIITISAPVRYPDGSFAGVTAIDRTVEGILRNIQLPERWAEGAEKMLVAPPHPADASANRLSVLIHESYVNTDTPWHQEITLETVESRNSDQLVALVSDLWAGIAGVRRMEYNGQDALWAYRPLNAGQVAILVVVPYERITALARNTGEFLLKESTVWLEVTGLGLLGVAVAAMILAARRAKTFTEPIRQLTDAGVRLAGGDYDALVHISTRDELEELGRIFNETGPKLKERERVKRSLELARVIQQNLLPQTAPELAGLDMAGQCVYCDETGGDYYDFIDLPSPNGGTVGVALGDVTGHGIGAALLMASIRSALRAEAQHYGPDLVGLFGQLNRQIVRDTEDDKFVTLFYGLLHQATRSLTWASGGHDPALLYRARTGQIDELGNTGMLLGLIEEAPFEQAGPLSLESGDILVVGTDGIWEARNANGLLFGKDRLFDIMRSGTGQTAQELCATITSHVLEFIGSAPPGDDITLVVVKAT